MNFQKFTIEELLLFNIGGGWGEEEKFLNSKKVNVIRGTDFLNIFEGNLSEVPKRFEKEASISKRCCLPEDIILEISGGSASKEQYVGRAFFLTKEIYSKFSLPIIPASFCRLLRFNPQKILPRYAYFYLKKMYLNKTISIYEVQSTGISNFQFTDFIKSEKIPLPSLENQKKIVENIANLEDHAQNLYEEAKCSTSIVDLLITKNIQF